MNKEDRKDLVERLREDDASMVKWLAESGLPGAHAAKTLCGEAAGEIDRLRRELEEARKALAPFARAADRCKELAHGLPVVVNINECRAARAALRTEEQTRGMERYPKVPGTALYDHRETFVHKPIPERDE